jgi:hypothetical protein
MSADIISFVRRPNRGCEPTDFPSIVFRAVVESDHLTINRADTAPCEHPPAENDFLT